MNTEPVIKVSNLSKRYRLGTNENADTFAGSLKNAITYPIRNLRRIARLSSFKDGKDESIFWALKDINFEVKKGEVLGIIGHNGAGKSTLLKILSRITPPTTGGIKINGRVSSLLEVGTGFHPELSGRDNIYMNGTVLGMTKKEIDVKLDEIIHFAGVKNHIDTPVKFYSTGMKVRLGFSVAAHLEPEILIIDEVLAVGDAEFQKKCLGKMEEVANSGRTILFVSHNMASISTLCSRLIVLEKGEIKFDGDVEDGIDYYMSGFLNNWKDENRIEKSRIFSSGEAEFVTIDLFGNELDTNKYFSNLPIGIKGKIEVNNLINDVLLDIRVISSQGNELTYWISKFSRKENIDWTNGLFEFQVLMDNNFQEGKYFISIGIHYGDGKTIDYLENVMDFDVMNFNKDGRDSFPYSWKTGKIKSKAELKITKID